MPVSIRVILDIVIIIIIIIVRQLLLLVYRISELNTNKKLILPLRLGLKVVCVGKVVPIIRTIDL